MRRALVVAGLATLGVVLFAAPASAHALVSTATPERGSAVDAAPTSVSILFTEEPELSLSDIDVLDADGRSVAAGPVEQDADEPKILRRPITELGDGVYTVAWRTLSKVDGHVTAGAFAFGVGVDPSEVADAGVTTPDEGPPPSATEVIGRALFLGGLGLLVGIAFVGAVAFGAVRPGSVRLAWLSWVAAGAGVILLAEAQRRAAGAGLGALLSTSIGKALIWRAAAVGVAGLALLIRSRLGHWLAGVAATAGIAVHAGAGHAGAVDPWITAVAGQTVHAVAAGVWLGGLAALLVGVRGAASDHRARAVRRFSTTAGVMLGLVVVTGVARSLQGLPTIAGLWESAYGRIILVKIGLVVVLGLLGLRNRRRNVPAAATDLSGLRRVSRVELGVGVAVLAAAALLASVTPPPPVSAVERLAADPIVVTGSDFGGRAEAELRITPGFPGSNGYELHLTGTRSSLDVRSVRLIFTYVEDRAVTSEVSLEAAGEDRWTGSGAEMALPGRWNISVLAQLATGGIEVPLSVATKCRAEVTPVEGGPTLYDVTVSSGSMQGYTDPAERGFNEIHFTFFGPDGTEIAMADDPSVFATPPDGDRVDLVVRRFSEGHFVADGQLTPGVWRFDIDARTDQGEQVVACFNDQIEG